MGGMTPDVLVLQLQSGECGCVSCDLDPGLEFRWKAEAQWGLGGPDLSSVWHTYVRLLVNSARLWDRG